MKELLKLNLTQVDFSRRYVDICNSYDDFKSGGKFLKEQITNIISLNNIDLKYSVKDKIFYKDYNFDNISVRFSLKINGGMVGLFYYFRDKNNDDFILKRFNSVSIIQDQKFDELVKYPVPIAKSIEDLKEILLLSFNLHNDFINTF